MLSWLRNYMNNVNFLLGLFVKMLRSLLSPKQFSVDSSDLEFCGRRKIPRGQEYHKKLMNEIQNWIVSEV